MNSHVSIPSFTPCYEGYEAVSFVHQLRQFSTRLQKIVTWYIGHALR